MEPRTVITTRPRTRRTPLGDVVTVRKSIHDSGLIEEQITLECPLDVQDGRESQPYNRGIALNEWKGSLR